MRELSNKRSRIPSWKKRDNVSPNGENGMNVLELARDFDIAPTTLTTFLKNIVKIISHFFYQSIGENTIH